MFKGTVDVKHPSPLMSRWIRVNLNSNWTDPACTGLSDARQVLVLPYSMLARFQLRWRGQNFYSTRPIIGLFDQLHLLSLVWRILIELQRFNFNPSCEKKQYDILFISAVSLYVNTDERFFYVRRKEFNSAPIEKRRYLF